MCQQLKIWILSSGHGTTQHLNIYIYNFYIHIIFLARGEGREKEREKHQCVVASCAPPTGDLAYNAGMCPDWESNQ